MATLSEIHKALIDREYRAEIRPNNTLQIDINNTVIVYYPKADKVHFRKANEWKVMGEKWIKDNLLDIKPIQNKYHFLTEMNDNDLLNLRSAIQAEVEKRKGNTDQVILRPQDEEDIAYYHPLWSESLAKGRPSFWGTETHITNVPSTEERPSWMTHIVVKG